MRRVVVVDAAFREWARWGGGSQALMLLLGSQSRPEVLRAWHRVLVAMRTRSPNPSPTAAHQVRRVGFQTEDARHIMLTHLDLDHAGGLVDFSARQAVRST